MLCQVDINLALAFERLPCLNARAVVADNPHAPVQALMSHMPYRNGKCPICRQFITVPPREITALGRLVAKTAPDYYR
eukprot:scaffold332761_cov15-Prasinocladus_malaysianus.AAC.1